MTDKEKLLKLAEWFDAYDAKRGFRDTAVQDDLRRIAAEIEAKDARIKELEALVENAHKKLSEYIIPCRNCDDGIDEAVCTCAEPRHDFERLLEVIKALEARDE